MFLIFFKYSTRISFVRILSWNVDLQPVPVVNEVKVPLAEWYVILFRGLGMVIFRITIWSVKEKTTDQSLLVSFRKPLTL